MIVVSTKKASLTSSPKPRGHKHKIHPALAWCRSEGVVSVTLGAAGLMQAFEFWASAPTGTVVGGITWRPEFRELDVIVNNPTSRSYADLNLLLQPHVPIAAIGQVNNISDVTFEDRFGNSMHQALINTASGGGVLNPLVLADTDAGYKIRCNKLPANSSLKIVIAIAEVKWNPTPFNPLQHTIFDSDYILRIQNTSNEDHGTYTYWYGHANADLFTPEPATPATLAVDGTYFAMQRQRHFAGIFGVVNFVSSVLQR